MPQKDKSTLSPHLSSLIEAQRHTIAKGDDALKRLDTFAPSNDIERAARDQMRKENLAHRQNHVRRLHNLQDRFVTNYRVPHDSEGTADIDVFRITDSPPPPDPKPNIDELNDTVKEESAFGDVLRPADASSNMDSTRDTTSNHDTPSNRDGPSNAASNDDSVFDGPDLNRDNVVDSAEDFYDADSTMKSIASVTRDTTPAMEVDTPLKMAGAKTNRDKVDEFVSSIQRSNYTITNSNELLRGDGTSFDPPVNIRDVIDVMYNGRRSTSDLFPSGVNRDDLAKNIHEIFTTLNAKPTNTRAWKSISQGMRKRSAPASSTPQHKSARLSPTTITNKQLTKQMSQIFLKHVS